MAMLIEVLGFSNLDMCTRSEVIADRWDNLPQSSVIRVVRIGVSSFTKCVLHQRAKLQLGVIEGILATSMPRKE
jgi:hypothetical protein